MKLKMKRKPEKANKMVFGNKHAHVKPIRKIRPASVSLLSKVSYNKPVKKYWGDSDGDGVINGLDCEPRNKFKQGPQHKKKRYYRRKTLTKQQADSLFKSGGTPLIKKDLDYEDDDDDSGMNMETGLFGGNSRADLSYEDDGMWD